MRYAAKVDGNQAVIVDALRKAGHDVFSLAAVGKGFADLIVFTRNNVYILLEVKNSNLSKSRRKLTPGQVAFRQTWRGPIITVETPLAALTVCDTITGYSKESTGGAE